MDEGSQLLPISILLSDVEKLPAIAALSRELERERLDAADALEKGLPTLVACRKKKRVTTGCKARNTTTFCTASPTPDIPSCGGTCSDQRPRRSPPHTTRSTSLQEEFRTKHLMAKMTPD